MSDSQVQSLLGEWPLGLPPTQWLSDPLRERIDTRLDVPAAMLALRDPNIHTTAVWAGLRGIRLTVLLVLLVGGLGVFGLWRSWWLQ